MATEWMVQIVLSKKKRKGAKDANEVLAAAIIATCDEGVAQGGENFKKAIICADGVRRNLCVVPYEVAKKLWAKRQNLGFNMKVFAKDGENNPRDFTDAFLPAKQIVRPENRKAKVTA